MAPPESEDGGVVEPIWRGCGEDVEGKSGRRKFVFRAYDEEGWKGILRRNEDGVERAVRLRVDSFA